MSFYKSIRKRTLLIIVTTLIIVIAGISNHINQLHYDKQFNDLILKFINSKNNEKIFHTINDEHYGHDINVLDISGGAFRDLQYLVYLLRVNDHYLNKNMDMLRMFNVFGGISSGSIIACAIAYRELVLKNIVNNNKSEFIQFMKMFKYSDTQITKCIVHVANESTQLNYGTLILQWMCYAYLFQKDKVLNVSVFKQITTLHGYLHPLVSSNDKRAHFKKYFDFDMKDIVKSRIFIACGVIIPNKIKGLQIQNKIILFTNSTNSPNNPNIIKPEYVISNMADIINVTTNTTGIFSVNEQYPNAWDATVSINNISMIIVSLFTNYSTNLNLKYISLNDVHNLIYDNDDGLLWWFKNNGNLMHINTKYDMEMIQHIQKNKAQHVIFKNNTKSFDASNAATLKNIQSGINGSTNIFITFIQNEILAN